MSRKGVLPKQMLRELFNPNNITGVEERYLNPASIDLPLTEEAYRIESIFLILNGQEKVRDLLPLVGATEHHLDSPFEVGVPYLIRVAGTWKLPGTVYGYANPKSSTGRIGFFCRTVADGIDMYDSLNAEISNPLFLPGWSGEIWMLVRAEYFPIRLQPGIALSQMRLFDGKSFLDDLHSELAIQGAGLIFDENGKKLLYHETRRHDDSFLLTIHVGGMMGWECRGTRKILDMSKLNFYDPKDFFEPIHVSNGKHILRKNCFYILTTKQQIKVPSNLSAELRAIEERLGEFRSHAAGYIDPGWGCGADGNGCGRPITLEVIPQEDMLVRDGQRIARIRYEEMKDIPEILYDDPAHSNYTDQWTARLSKHFKKPTPS